MGPKASKTKRPTSAKHSTLVKPKAVPRLPQELIGEILNNLAPNSDFQSLRSCALVSKSWVQTCRRRLFHTVVFTRMGMRRWLERFPAPEESPAHLIKHLYVWVGIVPDRFYEYTPWFTNAKRLSLLGYGGIRLLQEPSRWRSPQSVTSLTISTGLVTLMEIRDIMMQLPNLDSLWLSGPLIGVVSPGIGTILKGKFGGELRLSSRYTGESITNMLLEIPTGIHFTEFQIESPRMDLPSNVKLLEACGKTIVKLSYMVDSERESHSFSWPSRF